MNNLPSTWIICEIGLIAKIVAGGTPSSTVAENFTTPGNGIPWLTPADLSHYFNQEIKNGRRDLTLKGLASCSAILIPKGAVLFSSRAPIGYVVIAENEITTNQGFKNFILQPGINNRYIYFYLKYAKPIAEAMATGTTFKELSGATVGKLPVIIAPENEQKRIADKLDALLMQVDACRNRLDKIPGIIKRFRQVVLGAATSGKLSEDWRNTNDHVVWKTLTLGSVINDMRNGLSAKPNELQLGKRILRISAVRPMTLDLSDHRFLEITEKDSILYNLKKHDILFTRYNGSLEFVGACAVLNEDALDYVYPDKLIRVRTNPAIVNAKYLEIICNSKEVREQIEGFVKSSAGQKGISGADLKSTKLPIPTISEQAEIVRRVETLFAFADRLEARYSAARAQVENLTPALLAKAFRGELVPQDPNDEPASALLERIQAQRAESGKVKKPRASKT